jgi:hypothetical protein
VTNKIDYSYDAAGNRSAQVSGLSIWGLPPQVTNSTYNAANQQLAFGTRQMLYDLNGNVTSLVNVATSVTNKFSWNARNQNNGGHISLFWILPVSSGANFL